MFQIIGCPMHYGVGAKGLIHSVEYLRDYCKDLDIQILPEIPVTEDVSLKNLKNLNGVISNCEHIAKFGHKILTAGRIPLYVAGDHSAAIGTVSASSSFFHRDLGLIWIDAHPDINTDKTTVTGNIHGMPVAALLGLGEKKLVNIFKNGPKLKPENVVMLGLRDIDPPEAVILKEQKIRYYTYEDILKKGLQNCLDETVDHLSHVKHVHLSFDIDAMDPQLFPGVSVPVASGFHEEDAYTMLETLQDYLPICSYDVVEFNHQYDIDNTTADFTQRLIRYMIKRHL